MGRHATDESVAGAGPVNACSGGSLVVTEQSIAAARDGPPGLPRPAESTAPPAAAQFIRAGSLWRGER